MKFITFTYKYSANDTGSETYKRPDIINCSHIVNIMSDCPSSLNRGCVIEMIDKTFHVSAIKDRFNKLDDECITHKILDFLDTPHRNVITIPISSMKIERS